MKKLFPKTFTIFLIFALLVSALTVHSKEDLYEKYGYQENFEYEDEMIGHALKACVPKIVLEYSARMRYKPVRLDVDALAVQVDIWYEELAPYYSDEELSRELLKLIENNLYKFISYGSYREETVEGSGHGSGVVISDNGYIATNAHVATLDEQSKMSLYMYSLSQSVIEDLDIILDDLSKYKIHLNEEQISYIHNMILYQASENAQIKDEKTVLKACFPSSKGETGMDSAKTYEAELIEIGSQEGVDGLTQDTAILKIDADNLISLPLSQSYPESNSQIVSAGYPAVAEEIFSGSGSDASTLSVSIGTGKVARIVDIDGEQYKAIQISTTISNGNSGGPSVDERLQIEGLNTYVSVSDMRFAYMVSAEFVKSLTKDISLKQGETTKTFLTGLQLLQQGYGPAAQECFEEVQSMQKDTPYIEHLNNLAEDAPENVHPADEYKETNLLEIILNNPLYLTFSIVLIVLIILIILISIILICKTGKKKKKKSEVKDYSRTYIPAATASTPSSYIPDDTPNNYQQQNDTTQQEQVPSPTFEYMPEQNTMSYEGNTVIPTDRPRLKSTMKKAVPEETKASTEIDASFHTPTDI